MDQAGCGRGFILVLSSAEEDLRVNFAAQAKHEKIVFPGQIVRTIP